MLVDSALVGQEVRVDGEGGLDRTVLVDFLHDVLFSGGARGAGTVVEIRGPRLAILALLLARRSWISVGWAGVLGVGNVMIAAGEWVGIALQELLEPIENKKKSNTGSQYFSQRSHTVCYR